ncbi:glycosyltransferase family 2 protein [Roseomonas sp. BN140053]|uniref:glycosyltransferase family 2 protein n=1 Tax=Roseomonas sp. BN140053 TaxID=3391898 RepID=UPI0039EC1986
MGEAADRAASGQAPGSPWLSPGAPVLEGLGTATGLMLGLPCYGGLLTTATLRGLLETQRACLGLELPFTCVTLTNESLIPRARNTLLAFFLASEASHLLFVDADIGFGAASVLRLLAHDRPLIGGLYRRKRLDRQDWVVGWLPSPDGSARRDPRTGAVEVAHLGTGFLCLRRDLVERMAAAHPNTRYRPDPEDGPPGPWRDRVHALFESGLDPETGQYFSEDYLFCRRWRALGGEVWCDPAILLEHHGQASFRGDPMDQFRPG